LGQFLRPTRLRKRGSSLAGQVKCGKLIAMICDDLLKLAVVAPGTIQFDLKAQKTISALK
jgi:hypothetical protein